MQHFPAGGVVLIPGQEIKILHASQWSKKIEKKKRRFQSNGSKIIHSVSGEAQICMWPKIMFFFLYCLSGKEFTCQCRRHKRYRTWVWSLGRDGMVSHSRIIAWKMSWTEETGGLQSMGLQTVGHDLVTEHRNGKAQIYMWPKAMFFQL